MIGGVVLDVDDTLSLERDYVRSGFEAVGAWCRDEWGLREIGESTWALFLEGRRRTTLSDALVANEKDLTDAELQRVVEGYRSHVPSIAVPRMLENSCSGTWGRSGWGSSRTAPPSPARQVPGPRAYAIADPIMITADLHTSKPDPSVYRLVEEHWSLSGPRDHVHG